MTAASPRASESSATTGACPGLLTTARMLLRPLGAGDEAGYIDAVRASVPQLNPHMALHKEGETDAQMFARQLAMVSAEQAAGKCLRLVGVLEGGRIAGGFNLNAIERGLEWKADIAWWVATPLAGRGLATEGVAALLGYALGDLPNGLGLHQVHAWITADNPASIRVAQKAGLVKRPGVQESLNCGTRWAMHERYTRSA